MKITSADQIIRDSDNFQVINEMRMFPVDAPDEGFSGTFFAHMKASNAINANLELGIKPKE